LLFGISEGVKMIILGFSEGHTQKRSFVLLFKTNGGKLQPFYNLKGKEKASVHQPQIIIVRDNLEM
jgi:hypothetical protein